MTGAILFNDIRRMRAMKVMLFCIALVALFFAYFDTVKSFPAIWNSSDTFAHGYVIAPISVWLIWGRRQQLAQIDFQVYWPALILLALCGFTWLLASFAEVQVIKQYAFVLMIPALVLCLLGSVIAKELTFPLCFLLLAVPFGEAFIPSLINFTANFTVAALQISGIPVLREGMHFSIPSGDWSVVEACSGVRYLISSLTLGCLFAYLSYQSWQRRFIFIVFSAVVPIVANGIRAYLVVMIGHLSSMQLAVGFDHLIYGWIFFGLVMFLMFWIGSFWRQKPILITNRGEKNSLADWQSASWIEYLVVVVCAVICFSAWPMYHQYSDRGVSVGIPIELSKLKFKWTEIPAFSQWQPGFQNARVSLNKSFQRDWYQVGISIRYYKNQSADSKLISSTNQVSNDDERHWHILETSRQQVVLDKMTVPVLEYQLQDALGHRMLVWQFYLIDDVICVNPYMGKILQAKSKLLMHGDDGAAIFIFSPFSDKPEEARLSLRPFLQDNVSSVLQGLTALHALGAPVSNK